MKHETIDHDRMAENQTADRYLMGKLSQEELDWYENHFPTCDICLEQLELAEALRKTVKITATIPEESPKVAEVIPIKKSQTTWIGLSLAAGMVLGLLAPFLIKNGAASPTHPILDLDVPEYVLISERSYSQRTQIIFNRKNQLASIRFATPGIGTLYKLVFLNEALEIVYQTATTKANQDNKLILVSRDLLEPGNYTLNIETVAEDGSAAIFAQYGLEIAHEKQM